MAEIPGVPLWKKLGLKPGMRAGLVHPPKGWAIPEAPDDVEWRPDGDTGAADLIVAFFHSRAEYESELAALGERIRPDGMLWAAWPRKSGGHASDLGDRVVRDAALRLDLVDVKVAALDNDWSSLKLVIRKERRQA
jgi:hypothetical protein